MKAIVYITIALLFSISTNSQIRQSEKPNPDKNMVKPGDLTDSKKDLIVLPKYPDGGFRGFENYVNTKLDKTKISGKIKKGRIYVTLQVEKDGTISDASILRNKDFPELNNQIIKVLKLSPKWTSGTKKGVAAKMPMHLPLTISN